MSQPFERLKYFIENHYPKTQTELGRQIERSKGMMSNLLKGRQTISKGLALEIQEATGLNAEWLLTGEGPMMVNEATHSTAAKEVASLPNMVAESESAYGDKLDASHFFSFSRFTKARFYLERFYHNRSTNIAAAERALQELERCLIEGEEYFEEMMKENT